MAPVGAEVDQPPARCDLAERWLLSGHQRLSDRDRAARVPCIDGCDPPRKTEVGEGAEVATDYALSGSAHRCGLEVVPPVASLQEWVREAVRRWIVPGGIVQDARRNLLPIGR